MRVVFLGFQTWGHASLQALLGDPCHTVPLVVTHPQSSHPYEAIWADSVADLATAAGIEVVTARSANLDGVPERIAAAAPDVLVCSDWRTWVAPEVLRLARHGGVNIHDGFLPEYGGFAPINWAISRGEEQVGLTAHCMDEEFDLGDVVVQRCLPVAPTDTATDVARRVFALLPAVTLEALDRVADPGFRPVPQDRGRATFFHKRSDRDARIDWSLPAVEVHDLVRAQSDPYPNAHARHAGRRLHVKRASLPDQAWCGTPGRVFARVGDGVVVLCGPGRDDPGQGLVLEVVQPEGGDAMPAAAWFRTMGDYLD
ncbi:methionyl-tRNA formyltransferase [Salsipaludibacter albus]|uniref:methionyl-tRNA formyltransferase n=1 Tax=Salsipaludibacter albus TaxID=2849650 RepID=UPI001EE3AA95|nr:methionyl-tRNA formyltransferase [Salsipaludibacter albus]MBY5163626.1 methionyl-tRNA formyltransferase [Salsipaludibacter albus]